MSSTDPRLLISSGYLFEWLRPALFSAAALASAWVFARALRRGFPVYLAWGCALAALVLPAVALPLFLAVLVFTRGPAPANETPDTATHGDGQTTGDELPTEVSEKQVFRQPQSSTREAEAASLAARRRRALPYLYAALVFAFGALYFYRDLNSADARLARAADAKLRQQREPAIREYEAALRLEDDPHTRKLLALELTAAGRHEEALTHLRAARAGREPDGLLPFHLATSLEALARPAEAAAEYRSFLDGEPCRRPEPDPRCDAARTRLRAAGEPLGR